jgi:SAM-dependent methyltransferase
MSDVTRAGDFWDAEVADPTHSSWMEDVRVRVRINSMIGGSEPLWPVEWLEKQLGPRKFGRALSIGCGTGPLERELIARGLCETVDAFDGSVHSLHVARRLAEEQGAGGRIRYFASDFNRPALPRNRYDIVFFHQSLHHVGKLEKLYRAVLRALKPEGYLYLDEFVGPSRHEWDRARVAPHQAALKTIPGQYRRTDKLPLPVQPDDPSEAIRSAEIMEQLAIGFRVEAMRGYGGNLLSVLYPHFDWQQAPDELVQRLMAEEDKMLTSEPSYYAVVLARPEQLPERRLYALWRWFFEPKWKRVLIEIGRRTR